MAVGLSIRRTAQTIGIHPSTAFRWRHRLCRGLLGRPDLLDGRIETVELRLPFSAKGVRRPHAERRRARSARMRDEPVLVLIACDRLGSVRDRVLRQPVRVADLQTLVGELPGPATIVAAEGRLGTRARFARAVRASFADSRGRQRPRTLDHLRNAKGYARRFRHWLRRFRGVSTRYLDHYLAWHRVHDREERDRLERRCLSWPQAWPATTHISCEHDVSAAARDGEEPP